MFPSGSSCSFQLSTKELEVLAENQELLDAGFFQMLETVAQMASEQGEEDTANWLRNLANQLREALHLTPQSDSIVKNEENSKALDLQKIGFQSLSEDEIQTYFQFLMEILQATAESGDYAQKVYQLLSGNIDKLDARLAELLRVWSAAILEEAKTDEAEEIAVAIVLLSNLIQQFSLGDKASNMEIAK